MKFGNRDKLRIRHLIRSFHCWLNLGFCEGYVLIMGFVFTKDSNHVHRVGFRSFFDAVQVPVASRRVAPCAAMSMAVECSID